MINWSLLRERVNGDPEWSLAARHWTASVRLDLGEASRRIRLVEGQVVGIEPCEPDAECDLFVGASESVWSEMLVRAPRPYYQDLYGAQVHHGVRLPEDPIAYAAYYPALRRLVQLMAGVREGS